MGVLIWSTWYAYWSYKQYRKCRMITCDFVGTSRLTWIIWFFCLCFGKHCFWIRACWSSALTACLRTLPYVFPAAECFRVAVVLTLASDKVFVEPLELSTWQAQGDFLHASIPIPRDPDSRLYPSKPRLGCRRGHSRIWRLMTWTKGPQFHTRFARRGLLVEASGT